MEKKDTISASDNIILNLKNSAKEKEIVRRKLLVTAAKLAITAEKLAVTAKEKEGVRLKLIVTAKEKEIVRRKLVVTAEKLATTAAKLAVTAKEKEIVRRKLSVTAEELVVTAEKLAATAKEKESVRRKKLVITATKLAVTAEKLALTAEEKEIVRRKLAVTAEKLVVTAAKLAVTAKEKEIVRRKLAVTAKELAHTAEKLALTAEKLATTAAKLAATAKEKEIVRRKLAVIAKEKEIVRRKLAVTAKEKEIVRRKLVVTAKEKEIVRRKLEVTAEKLKGTYETLEKKVLERTKDLDLARVKEEAILLSIGDGLLVTDEKGCITIINSTAERLIGKKSKEVVGKFFSDVMLLEDEKGNPISSDKYPVNIVLVNGTMSAGPAYYFVRKDKTRFPMAIMATPVVLEGRLIGAIKIFRDITYEREVDKAKTEFVSLASHQLRTPLSAVNWYSEMLLAGDAGALNEKQKKYLDEVYRSNKRMVELVNALLDVSSLELGTFVIEPEPTDIIELTQSVVDEQKSQINAKKIVFSYSFEGNTLRIQADPKLLRMVVQNILSNAVKYTPERGKIKLSIKLADKKNILLRISDTGYGIPQHQHNKIFTKLFRADNVRDKDTDGTGLGLYIVKSIVENSGGKIWFESSTRKEKHGTVFYVTLPLDGLKKSAQ